MAKKGYFSAERFTPRALPQGYTQVEYIESNGTQYIDTGFIPNQDTRVVMEAEHSVTNAVSWLFGVRTASGRNAFAFLAYSNKYRTDYNNISNSYYDASIAYMTHVDKNKNITTLNGTEVITQTYASFNCQYSLLLLAMNTAGTASGFASVKLKNVLIYDNGTLVRDFVPCLNSYGTAGLYDMVNGVFYANVGTGSFAVGDTLRENVAREPNKVYFSDNGVARRAKKAYFGDKNGIARRWYQYGTPISTLAIGKSVYMNVNGARTEFLVVHQGIPDAAMYDSSCDGTWLLMKDLYEKRVWDSSNINDYENSDIHTYLNSTFLALFDSGIRSVIKQVKIPYMKGATSVSTKAYGSNGLSTKIFLLSCYELGWTDQVTYWYPEDGACLSYFSGTSDTGPKRIAYYNGIATIWWIRSQVLDLDESLWGVDTDGGGYIDECKKSYGIRPALILPSTALIDENFNVIA